MIDEATKTATTHLPELWKLADVRRLATRFVDVGKRIGNGEVFGKIAEPGNFTGV